MPELSPEALHEENTQLTQRIAELEAVVRQLRGEFTPPTENELAKALLDGGCIRFGRFTLKSGRVSPVYLDLRRLASYPNTLHIVAAAYLPILEELTYDHLAAVPFTALPIGTAISLANGASMIYPRREVKDHGTQVSVEGVFQAGDTAVVIDDVATTGLSTTETIEKLKTVQINTQDIVVLVDREEGASEALAAIGQRLHSVTTLRNLIRIGKAAGAVSDQQLAEIGYQLD